MLAVEKPTIKMEDESVLARRKAILIDADYAIVDGKTAVRLLMKGKRFFRLYDWYEPYFYADAPESALEEILSAKAQSRGRVASPTKAELVEREVLGKRKKIWKVYCQMPYDVPALSSALSKYPTFEKDIPFGRRYLIDKGLAPFSTIVYERQGKWIKRIVKRMQKAASLRTMSFDIETYNPTGMPRPDKDEIIMISYEIGETGERKVITSKEVGKGFAVVCKDEREMIKKFLEAIKENDVEVLFGYNSTAFDLPYLKARADANGLDFPIGRDGKPFRTRRQGIRDVAEITGRIHLDLYPIVRFMGFIGAFKVSKYSLENAYEELTGKKKLMVRKLEIWKMWENPSLVGELAEYSLFDAQATMEIGKMLLPLEMEMSRLTRLPLFDAANATAGQLVESLLMHKSFERGAIIPNKPDEALARERELGPIKGAFVKLPQPGIYEGLVVFDFRGLYPSIITSHNIDPFTLNPPSGAGDAECYVSPSGSRFAKSPRGLIPSVLQELIAARSSMKQRLKEIEKDTAEYEMLFARVQSLKILANSYYGYLAYPRSRWYSRECGEAVTAWGRHFIQETIQKAEQAGFEVLYGDTDSIFLLMGGKTKQEALEFMKKINEELPGDMELELEGFYPRGVFVTKKGAGEETGAKKKYALIGEDGKIKIRGFELVRRDWSAIAKSTQRKVLEAILKYGSKEKAVSEVRKVIERLRSGEVPLEELAIYTQIRKDPRKYDVKSPELSAAQKAIAAGMPVEKGHIIGYVITKKGSSISEKAQPVELAKDYDPAYYIDNQVLPSVLKILHELGYREEDLRFGGEQKSLSSFF
ncbi:MAG: DNA-directed DNA polymerase [Candidatus Micrarchaeota archaeon]|nr:DNA-directed DNA polymerase [Candidatus Micrarchaeota archaeon]